MPGMNSVHIDRALTNLSVKYFQDASTYIADKVFPIVRVQKQSDRYFVYQKEDWFKDVARVRAAGTESAGSDYTIDNTPTYFCTKYAIHKDVTEDERVNTDEPLNADLDAVDFVTDKILLKRENDFIKQYFNAATWDHNWTGTAGKYWDDANSDPILDVTTMASNIASVTGKRPNTLTLGRKTYDALRQHPDILDRIKFTQKGVITTELLATLLDVERVLVANAVIYDHTAVGGNNMHFMFGDGALLTYAPQSAGIRKASAGYIFTWTGLYGSQSYGARIHRIPMPMLGVGTERIEGEIAYDMKVVSKDLGAFFAQTVTP